MQLTTEQINQHENPARLEFVKQYLQELESAV